MKKGLNCPINAEKSCKFIEMSFISKEDDKDAVLLIKKTFPHMTISSIWYSKIRDGDTIVLKENGKKMIGIANVSYMNGASLDLLAIDPKYQGNGMGSMLLKEAEDLAIMRKNKFLKLMTEQVKTENVSFYSRKGYKVVGFNEKGYDHSPSVHFKKNL